MKEKLQEIINLLNKLDTIRPPDNSQGAVKGHSIKLYILLLTIAKYEGETQIFYAEMLGWTKANTSIHAGYLFKNGLISKAFDDRDMRKQSRRLYITPKGKEFIEEILKKD
ncbi:hypothetical protein [Campylobacter hyointestinalis]|uniref:hypothetical protein n=1 Tax=Campylobacter hyointestinalis TaxID=198 RepID=UPI000725E62C|nr:hypothetical protein [Campylobacter hyointestinalis]CUU77631.1 Uncharacterised protein [Campylobacter hyointestinalis subsp. hyointestinalis]